MTDADLNFCTLCLALVYFNLAGENLHLVTLSPSLVCESFSEHNLLSFQTASNVLPKEDVL